MEVSILVWHVGQARKSIASYVYSKWLYIKCLSTRCLTRAREPLVCAWHWPINPDMAEPSSAMTLPLTSHIVWVMQWSARPLPKAGAWWGCPPSTFLSNSPAAVTPLHSHQHHPQTKHTNMCHQQIIWTPPIYPVPCLMDDALTTWYLWEWVR